jgi:hypothetical protein
MRAVEFDGGNGRHLLYLWMPGITRNTQKIRDTAETGEHFLDAPASSGALCG